MITPFKRDGAVDYEAAERLAVVLVADGSDGVVVSGTTGESPALSDDEKVELVKAIKQAIPGKNVVAGTGSNDTHHSVKLSERAMKAGADALLAVVPYYNKPTQDGMLEHFGAIAQATSLPVVLYNVPARTGANMLPATAHELARRHPSIAGVKESTASVEQFSALVAGSPRDDFTVWSGDDFFYLPALALGTQGWSYPGGTGAVYDAGAEPASVLGEYAREYARVEVVSTFYGAPAPERLLRWAQSVPAHFTFALKLPREISHDRRLVGCERLVEEFFASAAALGPQLEAVLGHELTHGVTEKTLNLDYLGQAGALNESISDVFGSLVKQYSLGQTADQADWLIGADIMGPVAKQKGYTCLRNMAAPRDTHALAPQPDHYNSGIGNMDPHYSSGPPNLAFCKAAQAIGGHSWEKAGQIWYKALTGFGPSPNMTMNQFANQTRSVAQLAERFCRHVEIIGA